MFSWWLMADLEAFFLPIPANPSPHLTFRRVLVSFHRRLALIVLELSVRVMTQHSLTSWASSLSVFDIHLCIFCIISKNYYYYYKTVFLHFSFWFFVWKILTCCLIFLSCWLICVVMVISLFCVSISSFCQFYIISLLLFLGTYARVKGHLLSFFT